MGSGSDRRSTRGSRIRGPNPDAKGKGMGWHKDARRRRSTVASTGTGVANQLPDRILSSSQKGQGARGGVRVGCKWTKRRQRKSGEKQQQKKKKKAPAYGAVHLRDCGTRDSHMAARVA